MQIKKYEVYRKESMTSSQSHLVGTYKSWRRAETKVNQLNEEYGAYIAYRETVYVDEA